MVYCKHLYIIWWILRGICSCEHFLEWKYAFKSSSFVLVYFGFWHKRNKLGNTFKNINSTPAGQTTITATPHAKSNKTAWGSLVPKINKILILRKAYTWMCRIKSCTQQRSSPFSISVVMFRRVCASVYGKGLNPRVRTRVLLLRVSICEHAFFYNFILAQYFQYFAQRVCLKNNKVLAVVEIHLGARSPRQPSTPQIGCMRE